MLVSFVDILQIIFLMIHIMFLSMIRKYDMVLYPGFPRRLESPGIFIGKFRGPEKLWKMTSVLESPGICQAKCRRQFSASNRHVFFAAGIPKMLSRPGLSPGPSWGSSQHSPDPLLLFVAIFKHCWLTTRSSKMFLGSWKVLQKSWNFVVAKSVGTLCIPFSVGLK